MPFASTDDGVKLYYEESGGGTPVLFVHEFAGDHRSWGPQVSALSRQYRCIVYSARGYPPPDVPEEIRALFAGERPRRCALRPRSPRYRARARGRPVDGRLRDAAFRPRVSAAGEVAGRRRVRATAPIRMIGNRSARTARRWRGRSRPATLQREPGKTPTLPNELGIIRA